MFTHLQRIAHALSVQGASSHFPGREQLLAIPQLEAGSRTRHRWNKGQTHPGAIASFAFSDGVRLPVPNDARHAILRPGKRDLASCSAMAAGLFAIKAPSWKVRLPMTASGKYVGAAVVARSASQAGADESPAYLAGSSDCAYS